MPDTWPFKMYYKQQEEISEWVGVILLRVGMTHTYTKVKT